MKVVIKITGREAVPVRAIPFLTDWDKWSPDVLVSVFAGDASNRGVVARGTVDTFRLEARQVVPIKPRWWANFAAEQLAALDQRLDEARGRTPVAYDEWRLQSIQMLPAEAYVWLDDFSRFHERDWKNRARVFAATAHGFPGFVAKLQELGWGASADSLERADAAEESAGASLEPELREMLREEFESLVRVRHLDLSPLIPEAFRKAVSEGLSVQADAKSGGRRVLSDAEGEEIKKRLAEGDAVASLAKEFNVSRPTIDKYKPGTTFVTGLGPRKGR